MKALVLKGKGNIAYIEKARPTLIDAHGALLKPLLVSPCTSDVHTIWQGSPKRPDLTLGHEVIARVEEVGAEVTDFYAGDVVAVSAITPDWSQPDVEENYAHAGHNFSAHMLGNTIDGAFQELFYLPYADRNLAHIPDGLTLEDALMCVDVLQTGFTAVEEAGVKPGDTVLDSTKEKKERVGRLVQMHANERKDISEIYSGDICAIVGLKYTTTGDTLCDEKHPIILEKMVFPEPVIQLSLEPKTKAGQEKMTMALIKLAEEDPTFKTYTDQETGQTIIAGMGELHLDIIVDRLLREFKVEANVGAPQVAYRETFRNAVDAEGMYKRQSGGKGQYGHCKIHLIPQEPGAGYAFEDATVGGSIPKEYIPAIDKGIQEAAKNGFLAGYEMVDFKVIVYDGSYHEVDSSEMAFKIAGSMAFKNGVEKAHPVLLEPIMKVQIITPEDYFGDLMGNISGRRGTILGTDDRNGAKIIDAEVPLSEMFGYATELRSRTQGRGQFTMQFDHYSEVPQNIAKDIIEKRGKKD